MIIEIIGIACIATLAADISAHFNLPEKPFQCEMCLGFWLGVGPLTFLYGWQGFCAAGISAVLANLIYKINERI